MATGFNYDYVTAGVRDFGSSAAPEEVDEKKVAKQTSQAKISSLDDLPSLPTKAEKEKAEEQDKEAEEKSKRKGEEKEADETEEDIGIEEIVKEVDTTLEETEDNQSADIMADDEDTGSLWDDIEVDDNSVDLNKPTFLRKLAGRRRDRKERKGQDKETEPEED